MGLVKVQQTAVGIPPSLYVVDRQIFFSFGSPGDGSQGKDRKGIGQFLIFQGSQKDIESGALGNHDTARQLGKGRQETLQLASKKGVVQGVPKIDDVGQAGKEKTWLSVMPVGKGRMVGKIRRNRYFSFRRPFP